jgi:hypothetical protein
MTSYLNAQRLKEHEGNVENAPSFKKNLKRFFALPSQASMNKSSHRGGPPSNAEKFESFLNKVAQ